MSYLNRSKLHSSFQSTGSVGQSTSKTKKTVKTAKSESNAIAMQESLSLQLDEFKTQIGFWQTEKEKQITQILASNNQILQLKPQLFLLDEIPRFETHILERARNFTAEAVSETKHDMQDAYQAVADDVANIASHLQTTETEVKTLVKATADKMDKLSLEQFEERQTSNSRIDDYEKRQNEKIQILQRNLNSVREEMIKFRSFLDEFNSLGGIHGILTMGPTQPHLTSAPIAQDSFSARGNSSGRRHNSKRHRGRRKSGSSDESSDTSTSYTHPRQDKSKHEEEKQERRISQLEDDLDAFRANVERRLDELEKKVELSSKPKGASEQLSKIEMKQVVNEAIRTERERTSHETLEQNRRIDAFSHQIEEVSRTTKKIQQSSKDGDEQIQKLKTDMVKINRRLNQVEQRCNTAQKQQQRPIVLRDSPDLYPLSDNDYGKDQFESPPRTPPQQTIAGGQRGGPDSSPQYEMFLPPGKEGLSGDGYGAQTMARERGREWVRENSSRIQSQLEQRQNERSGRMDLHTDPQYAEREPQWREGDRQSSFQGKSNKETQTPETQRTFPSHQIDQGHSFQPQNTSFAQPNQYPPSTNPSFPLDHRPRTYGHPQTSQTQITSQHNHPSQPFQPQSSINRSAQDSPGLRRKSSSDNVKGIDGLPSHAQASSSLSRHSRRRSNDHPSKRGYSRSMSSYSQEDSPSSN
ncbi:hypothetical protein BLNAU_14838 [Blattamonas nauphoetae]|uniref:Uncharacterized protein n=1 Tax=Blattamonas nauphoetae TaxID=2049346 RepID=A0ABQ9XEY6_9EUKA|nr:hypothetical protein BLNAU_14838 [Blattamonas nauphoetae]